MRHEVDRVPSRLALAALAAVMLIVAPWVSEAEEPPPGSLAPAMAEATPALDGLDGKVEPRETFQEPLAAKVRGILDTHCASCHQRGQGEAADLVREPSNLLDLDAVSKDRSLVQPGYPDASGLYLELLRRHRPADFFRDGTRWKGPTAGEIADVRRWIEALPKEQAGRGEPTTVRLAAGPHLRINLRADRKSYKAGDLLTLSVQVDGDCHLTLISIDGSGRAIVLFPNDLERDNKVNAGAMRRIPGDGAGYQLRLDKPGEEIISATCTSAAKPPLRIEHDFSRQRFTILGDWRKFLTTALDQEALGVPQKKKIQHRRARRRGEAGAPVADARSGPVPLELEARTAIIVKVE